MSTKQNNGGVVASERERKNTTYLHQNLLSVKAVLNQSEDYACTVVCASVWHFPSLAFAEDTRLLFCR